MLNRKMSNAGKIKSVNRRVKVSKVAVFVGRRESKEWGWQGGGGAG